MPENGPTPSSKKPSFWSQFTNFIDKFGKLIVAITGLLTVLATIGWIGHSMTDTLPPVPPTAVLQPTQQFEPTPIAQQTAVPAQPTVNLSGTWVGANGFTYIISQTGDYLFMQEFSPLLGGVSATSEGSIDGNLVTLDFTAIDGSYGRATLTLSENGAQLTGTFINDYWGQSSPAVLYRE